MAKKLQKIMCTNPTQYVTKFIADIASYWTNRRKTENAYKIQTLDVILYVMFVNVYTC